MASPQTENGYARIANELAEALARVNLSPYESRILWFVIRKTYGFKGKKMDCISLSQFSKGTGIAWQNVSRTLKALAARQIIIVERQTAQRLLYGLQKDYSRWLKPYSPQSKSRENKSPETKSPEMQTLLSTDEETLLSGEEYKRKKKITKDNGGVDKDFERAWSLYPKRAGGNSKKNAHAKWTARVRAGVNPEEMVAGVERYARFVRTMGKEGSQYVKQAEVFFGPGEHWKEGWNIPTPEPNTYRAKGGFVG